MVGNARDRTRSRLRSADAVDSGVTLNRIIPTRPLKHKIKESSSKIHIRITFKALFGFCTLVFITTYFWLNGIMNSDEASKIPSVITPYSSPKLMDLPLFQADHNEDLFWGTYRPHVYIGIRARTPLSLIAGLMWIGTKDGRQHIRHLCQDSDDLSAYGWRRHNGRDFGHHILNDHGLHLETHFLKSKNKWSGYGGDWALRFNLSNKKDILDSVADVEGHLFFYIANEDGTPLNFTRNSMSLHESSLLASGLRSDTGSWELHLKSKDVLETHHAGFKSLHFHNLSILVEKNIGVQIKESGQLQLSNSFEDSSNIIVFQISGQLPFAADIAFISGSGINTSIPTRVQTLTGVHLTRMLQIKQNEFNLKFQRSFNAVDRLEPESLLVGQAAVSNMLGSIGYFYGQSKIAFLGEPGEHIGDGYIPYWPAELYTAVPSQSFFPRGFLWDEGFHQMLIWRWDIYISLDIIGHWLDLVNADGWIPREQILGSEALSKVPEEFVLQYPSNANPPTLFMAIHDIVCGVKQGKFTTSEIVDVTSFLERAFVRLEAWFQWLNRSQTGKEYSSYFWHGRDNMSSRELNPKTLSSGLDDYPRASHPSEDERHLDLRCWMHLAANCLHSIEQLLQKNKGYQSTAELLSDFELLNQLHLDHSQGTYFDFGNHTEKVRLSWKLVTKSHGYVEKELLRDVFEDPRLRLVPHIGYVSLFPFMRKLIPCDSWILGRQLDMISNRSLLWTDYGLRSLSKTSSLYMKRNTEHDPPYWRGSIWINMNYLVLSGLHHYSMENGPHKDRARSIYESLRNNLIRNVVRNYHETGFLWEQYDQKTGKGKGAHPFTGWSSLILLIMSEAYS